MPHDAHDLHLIRDNLISVKAWIEHWQADVDCNLTPTTSSLASAHSLTAISLSALARIERDEAKERAAA